MTEHTKVVPPNHLATKSRALTVIENAAMRRREVLRARIKPLQDELEKLDRILSSTAPDGTEETDEAK